MYVYVYTVYVYIYMYGEGSKPCTPGEHQNSCYSTWMFIPKQW